MAWCDCFEFAIDGRLLCSMKHFLSADETERALNYKNASSGERFIICRGLLRTVVSRYIGCEPQNVKFNYSIYGKPGTDGVEFNMSHSGGKCFIAVSDLPVGIDCEKLERKDFNRISFRYFSRREYDFIASSPDQAQSFYTAWCLRESLAKAKGISVWKLMSENIIFDLVRLKVIYPLEYRDYFFKRMPYGDDFMTIVCSEDEVEPVIYFPDLREFLIESPNCI